MLSKLRNAGGDTTLIAGARKDLESDLLISFGGSLTDLQSVAGGTLNLCYSGNLKGQTRFFKTHAVPAGRVTLQREAAILESTARYRADAKLLTIQRSEQERIWLHMKNMSPCNPLSPEKIRDLVNSYECVLAKFKGQDLIPSTDNLQLLISKAECALAELSKLGLLSTVVLLKAEHCIRSCKVHCAEWSVQLCHGDLGPANIMTDGIYPLVVDWEDIFWGITGYDYLYWLTFFSNRQWLTQEALGFTHLGRANEVSLMIVILLLKSQLSVINGTYKNNRISLDARLLEVLSLA